MISPDYSKKVRTPSRRIYRPLGDLNGRVGTPDEIPLPKIREENEDDKENTQDTTPRRRLIKPITSHYETDVVPTSSTPLSRKHTTPKTPKRLPYNPFEKDLIPKLHLSICSPSVLTTIISPTRNLDENFDWPIEDISRIKPVQIEESPGSHFHFTEEDPETESKFQEAIDTFFKTKHIVPSPWSDAGRSSILEKHDGGEKDDIVVSKTVYTQTALSLPPVLPPELEEALKPYFNQEKNEVSQESLHYELQEEEEEEMFLNHSGLRRKLMFHAVTETNTDMKSSPLQSWRQGFSRSNLQVSRNIRSPTLSPITPDTEVNLLHNITAFGMMPQTNISCMEVSFQSNPTTPLSRYHRRSSILVTKEEQNRGSLRQHRFSLEEDQSMESYSGTPVSGRSPIGLPNSLDHGYHTDFSSRVHQFSSLWNSKD